MTEVGMEKLLFRLSNPIKGHSIYTSSCCKKVDQEDSWFLESNQKHPGQAATFLMHIKEDVEILGKDVVSYDFKEERFADLHHSGIGFPEARFFYFGTPASPTSIEETMKGEALGRKMKRREGSFHRPLRRRFPRELWCILVGMVILLLIVISRKRRNKSEPLTSQEHQSVDQVSLQVSQEDLSPSIESKKSNLQGNPSVRTHVKCKLMTLCIPGDIIALGYWSSDDPTSVVCTIVL